MFEAYCAGAWMLFWTDDTLYWFAKPGVHVEHLDGGRRMHREDGPALESDIEPLYFWHGVLVPEYVIEDPSQITVQHIRDEENAEVRRVMVERMGYHKFVEMSEVKVIHMDTLPSRFPSLPASELVNNSDPAALVYVEGEETAELLESAFLLDFEDRPLKFVRLSCPSTDKVYIQRVAHDETRVYAAVGRSFGMTEEEYKTGKYFRQGDVLMWALDQTDERIGQQHS